MPTQELKCKECDATLGRVTTPRTFNEKILPRAVLPHTPARKESTCPKCAAKFAKEAGRVPVKHPEDEE